MGLEAERQLRQLENHAAIQRSVWAAADDQSPSLGALFAALAKAQSVVKAAAKDHVNPHIGSKYADLASVWTACREALTVNALSVVQAVNSTPDGQIEVVTTLGHSSGEWMRARTRVQVEPQVSHKGTKQPWIQAAGSAITYARRYALAAMVGVAPDDDDDGNAAGASEPKRQRKEQSPPANGNASAPATFPNFGPAKGQPIRGAKAEHLTFYRERAKESMDDPAKERWRAKESALMGAIDAELARQKAEAAPPPKDSTWPAAKDETPAEAEARNNGANYREALALGERLGWDVKRTGGWLKEVFSVTKPSHVNRDALKVLRAKVEQAQSAAAEDARAAQEHEGRDQSDDWSDRDVNPEEGAK